MQGSIGRLVMFAVPRLAASVIALMSLPALAISDNILLGGRTAGGGFDPRATKVIATGCPGCIVIINFSACPDIRISSVQATGVFVNCAAKTISAVTDAVGMVTLRLAGAANTSLPSDPGSPEGCATMTVDGFPAPPLSVGAPDLNGARGGALDPGVDGTDSAQFTGNRFPGASVPTPPPAGPCLPGPGCFSNANYRPRANYVFTAAAATGVAFQFIDGTDTAVFTGFRFGGGSVTNGPFCP